MLLLLLLPLLLPTATSYYQCYQPVSLRHAMEFNIFFPSADLDNKVVETFVLPSLLYNGLNLAMAMSLLSLSLSLSQVFPCSSSRTPSNSDVSKKKVATSALQSRHFCPIIRTRSRICFNSASSIPSPDAWRECTQVSIVFTPLPRYLLCQVT